MGGSGAGASGAGGTGGVGGEGATGGSGGAPFCLAGTQQPCYEGPDPTLDVGACKGGVETCLEDGTAFGACEGQVTPIAEDCATVVDDDCDAEVNEPAAGCVCEPNASESCYEGPANTEFVGVCQPGTKLCAADGLGFGPCIGQVLPGIETCGSPADDDCDSQTNEEGADCACVPDSVVACYSGPPGTQNVGECVGGQQTCDIHGLGFGQCIGEQTPVAETCNTTVNDDCDALTNEEGAGCVCLPGSVSSCYTGPPGTLNEGLCQAGTHMCNAQGTAFGPCNGEVTPQAETCYNTVDESCDGQLDDGCVTTYATNVQPILAQKCAPCHEQFGSGGANFAVSYADSQLPSYYCPGFTKGACLIVRIQNGTMPAGGGCTGNPVLDAGNAACLTATQQSVIQNWISTGQLP